MCEILTQLNFVICGGFLSEIFYLSITKLSFEAALPNPVAIRYMWQQAFKMWRQVAFPDAVCIGEFL